MKSPKRKKSEVEHGHKQTPSDKRKSFTIRSITTFCAMVIAALFALSPYGRHIDLFCYDTFEYLSGPRKPAEEVVIVAIDEPSFAVLQQQWPWQRGQHARLINTLFKEGARAVAVDILFAEPSDKVEDQKLFKSLKQHSNTILAAALDVIDESGYRQQSIVMPAGTIILPETKTGLLNLPIDRDGFVRRGSIKFDEISGLAWASVQAFSLNNKDNIYTSPNVGEIYINYAGPPRTIPTVSYYQALEPSAHLPRAFFKDKLVFIGLSLQSPPDITTTSPDHFPFPYSRWGSAAIPGVEIHATIAENLLTGHYIQMLPWHWVPTTFIWLIGFITIVFLRTTPCIIATSGLTAVTLLSGYASLAWGRLFFPMTLPLLPLMAGFFAAPFPHLFRLRKEKQQIRNIFSKYIAPNVVHQLLENPEQVKLGGEMVDATVLYLDIAGFTKMASQMSPEALVALLSRYMGRFSDTIFEWEGMIDKYVGDAIMALWGAPLPVLNHPEQACQAALAIMQDLNDLQKKENDPTGMNVDIRIGINSGAMLAGNVGGKRFMDYTVHGEATNLAVRLEAINKIYNTRLILGQESASRLSDDFVTRKIDYIRLLGQSKPVEIHELVGLSSHVDSQTRQQCRLFEKARRLYLKQDFEEASSLFSQILNMNTSDGPSRVYLKRCKQYLKQSPPPSWDGITEIRVK